jgi:HK97 family phage prohead protease
VSTDLRTRALVLEPAQLRAASAADGEEGVGRLVGHFAVFNTPTEINNYWEGHFREQIAPGAFAKTFRERAAQIRCIYEHGHDPMFGRKPIGPPEVLREDKTGAYYEVPLYDNELNRDYLVPAARDGQLGASFRFQVIRETRDEKPADGGIPMVTIQEVKLIEFGPCPFGAYDDATAGVRSIADLQLWESLDDDGRRTLAELAERARTLRTPETEAALGAPEVDGAAPQHTEEPARGHSSDLTTPEERRRRLLQIRGVIQ